MLESLRDRRRRKAAKAQAHEMAMRIVAIGMPIGKEEYRLLADAGWSPATVDAIVRITDFAWGERTGIYWTVRPIEYETYAWIDWQGLACQFTTVGREWTTLTQAPVAVMVPWLAVLAGAPDEEDARLIQRLARDRDEATGKSPAQLWIEAAPGPLSALAYAAGLTLEETRNRAAAGDLAVDDLLVLIGLRADWKIAPDLLAPYDPSIVTPHDPEGLWPRPSTSVASRNTH